MSGEDMGVYFCGAGIHIGEATFVVITRDEVSPPPTGKHFIHTKLNR